MPTPTFVRPADLAPDVLAAAESLWASMAIRDDTFDGAVERLAALLGLDESGGHDELTRCDGPGCGAWFWADEGARVTYESGRTTEMCPEHALADGDPGARVYPGIGLEADRRDQDDAALGERIRTTGRPW